MILFFKANEQNYYAVQCKNNLNENDQKKLIWLFGNAQWIDSEIVNNYFVGPRREMITPWSTNAVEITQNMGIPGIERIEEFFLTTQNPKFDPMLQALYNKLDQNLFLIQHSPEEILFIDDIDAYNKKEGLALSPEEVGYLNEVAHKIGRKLSDSEVFGFSQVNSEHCRHKIFNGTFIIDGQERQSTLFQLIKQTAKENHNRIISAYKDNVAFIDGPSIELFAPKTQYQPDYFEIYDIDSIISLKAETHNFPTTVEPFNGASTGSGGEIRDRMAGGKGSFPIAGTAVYMTSYPRLDENRVWEKNIAPRKWLYQSPQEILIKASNGASDFGNKFGQPVICGSVFTFEHIENLKTYGFDKVIMLAGGIGFAKKSDSQKDLPQPGDKIVVMGGDNYRIGMGGGAVSSVATGEYSTGIELNAVQRANPEMQKRVYNVIRALSEMSENPIVSIHDHGAGGHLNSLSELVEATGGTIYINKLPIGDPTLSAKEIIGNESQERMGLIIKAQDVELITKIALRERAPLYIAGEVTGDMHFCFSDDNGHKPIDLQLEYLFGKPPRTILNDKTIDTKFLPIEYQVQYLEQYLENVLKLESVACKDWLTNKVDRSVTGRIAMQQTCGRIQLPLNNLGIVALDYQGIKGIATSLGHAPVSALIDSAKGSILSIAESLTNIIWAPIQGGLKNISLSANWMWPAKNSGEDARLYQAVEAAAKFAIELGINIPTGKDSLSMKQKYPDGQEVFSPGTVIISAVGEVSNIQKAVQPVLIPNENTKILYIDFSSDSLKLGGSSFAQTLNRIGTECPSVNDSAYFAKAFNVIQQLIEEQKIIAGHDVSSGGLITALLEMVFTSNGLGLSADISEFNYDVITSLFSENPAIVIQVDASGYVEKVLAQQNIRYSILGKPILKPEIEISKDNHVWKFDVNNLRKTWFSTSYLLDKKQCGDLLAKTRFDNLGVHELNYIFPSQFNGKLTDYGIQANRRTATGVKAAIIREKGVNGDREMAYSLYLAGFDVKDVHMTDLISGRETLEDIHLIVFVGGFSNSDVLSSAKGWAGAFLYNEKAANALDKFVKRSDTLTLGVCNGCQLMIALGLIYPEKQQQPKMLHNQSGKFESSFLTVDILPNHSVMLQNMAGSRLGIWVAHGEGKFVMPEKENEYFIPMKFSYSEYPGNPNGSYFNTAALCSADGRHLAMMPHLERSIFPWNWAFYEPSRKDDEVSPWIQAFVNARNWIVAKK